MTDTLNAAVTIHFRDGKTRTVGGLHPDAAEAILTWFADGKTATLNLTFDDGRRLVVASSAVSAMERDPR